MKDPETGFSNLLTNRKRHRQPTPVAVGQFHNCTILGKQKETRTMRKVQSRTEGWGSLRCVRRPPMGHPTNAQHLLLPRWLWTPRKIFGETAGTMHHPPPAWPLSVPMVDGRCAPRVTRRANTLYCIIIRQGCNPNSLVAGRTAGGILGTCFIVSTFSPCLLPVIYYLCLQCCTRN